MPVFICFANRSAGERSNVIGPFIAVEHTFNYIWAISDNKGNGETIAHFENERWNFFGREYETVLFVGDPASDQVNSIAHDVTQLINNI